MSSKLRSTPRLDIDLQQYADGKYLNECAVTLAGSNRCQPLMPSPWAWLLRELGPGKTDEGKAGVNWNFGNVMRHISFRRNAYYFFRTLPNRLERPSPTSSIVQTTAMMTSATFLSFANRRNTIGLIRNRSPSSSEGAWSLGIFVDRRSLHIFFECLHLWGHGVPFNYARCGRKSNATNIRLLL